MNFEYLLLYGEARRYFLYMCNLYGVRYPLNLN